MSEPNSSDNPDTENKGSAKAKRIEELRTELASLEAEQVEEVIETVDDAAEEVAEAVEEATDNAVEEVEKTTGETVTPDDRSVLADMIAERVYAKMHPPIEETEVVEAPAPAPEPDSPPARTHWSDRRVF